MRVRTVAVDRLVVFLIAVVLIASGVWALGWYVHVDVIRRALTRFDRRLVDDLPNQDWWATAVAATTVVTFVVGVALIVVNLSRRRTSSVRLGGDGAGTSVDLSAVAAGAARLLEDRGDVRRARGRAAVDRGVPTITLTAHIDATADILDVSAYAQRIADMTGNDLSGTAVRVHLIVDKTPGATVPIATTTTSPTTASPTTASTTSSAESTPSLDGAKTSN